MRKLLFNDLGHLIGDNDANVYFNKLNIIEKKCRESKRSDFIFPNNHHIIISKNHPIKI